MRMRKCANCGTRHPLSDGHCPECGTHCRPDGDERAVGYVLGYPQCEWEADGQRCRYPGSISSTIGAGPWYCMPHFGCESPAIGAQIVQASQDYRHATKQQRLADANAQAAAYRLQQATTKVKLGGGQRWAQDILNRIQAGEQVHDVVERMAREALGQ